MKVKEDEHGGLAMDFKNSAHVGILIAEALVLSVAVAWGMWGNRELRRLPISTNPVEFRMRFAVNDGMPDISSVTRMAVSYFFTDDQTYNAQQTIQFQPKDATADGWFVGTFPAGVTNFKIDFKYDRTKHDWRHPLPFDKFMVDGKEWEISRFSEYYWHAGDVPVWRYRPQPPLKGYLREFLWTVGVVFLLSTIVLVGVLSKLFVRGK